MKVAVSIPDATFAEAEGLAKRMKLSRSRIYARALDEFVANHDAHRVTDAMNDALAEVEPAPDNFLRDAARKVFARTEW
jgi:predicted transcriptional regulator